jgi:site-specific DNA-methyltransferase (adenine-specific)
LLELNKIYNEDCIGENGMCLIPDRSIDMILCDLPYGRTQNKWDSIISFEELWTHYRRIIKNNGCIALFADGLFMADLMISNRKMWKYNLIWNKVLTSGFLNANRMPLRQHEEICIFYNKQPTYNPQKVKGKPNHSKGKPKDYINNNYGNFKFVDNNDKLGDMKHPTSILTFPKPHPSIMKHPTEKSIECCEWLVKTYTQENETVLDNCMGSGTTAIACLNTKRNYIGFETDKTYYELANKRIEEHKIKPTI